jgi:hypothetical protein
VYSRKTKPSKETLYILYVVEAKTVKEISLIRNLSKKVVKTLLRKYGIYKTSSLLGFCRKLCYECGKVFYTKENTFVCNKCKKLDLGVENVNFVRCKICNARLESLVTHVTRIHGISSKDYQEKFKSLIICKSLSNKIGIKISNTIKKQWQQGLHNSSCHIVNQNKFEKEISAISDKLVYVGGYKSGYKRLWLRTSRLRNPDFVVINDNSIIEQLKVYESWYEKQDAIVKLIEENKLSFYKIIECNGLYWHKKRFAGRTLEQYEKDVIIDYKKIGKECLVVWDFQIKNNKSEAYKFIIDFINN